MDKTDDQRRLAKQQRLEKKKEQKKAEAALRAAEEAEAAETAAYVESARRTAAAAAPAAASDPAAVVSLSIDPRAPEKPAVKPAVSPVASSGASYRSSLCSSVLSAASTARAVADDAVSVAASDGASIFSFATRPPSSSRPSSRASSRKSTASGIISEAEKRAAIEALVRRIEREPADRFMEGEVRGVTAHGAFVRLVIPRLLCGPTGSAHVPALSVDALLHDIAAEASANPSCASSPTPLSRLRTKTTILPETHRVDGLVSGRALETAFDKGYIGAKGTPTEIATTQRVRVCVEHVDVERQRIALSLCNPLPAPLLQDPAPPLPSPAPAPTVQSDAPIAQPSAVKRLFGEEPAARPAPSVDAQRLLLCRTFRRWPSTGEFRKLKLVTRPWSDSVGESSAAICWAPSIACH